MRESELPVINSSVIDPSLREYVLCHDALARFKKKTLDASANLLSFVTDTAEGKLDHLHDTFIAYWKGILCGQSRDGKKLYDQASAYYGSSNLAVFQVVKKEHPLADAVKNAQGQF